MELVKYPDDLDWDEEAFIFDDSVFGRISFIEEIIDGKAVYVTSDCFARWKKDIFIVLHSIPEFRIRIRRDTNSRRNLLNEKDLIDVVENLGNFPNKKQILQKLKLLYLFTNGSGYMVNEKDKTDEIVMRKRYYYNKILEFKPLVPKVFLANYLGSCSDKLSPEIISNILNEYKKRVDNFSSNYLDSQDYDILIDSLARCITYRNISSKGIKEDINLVALACAVPARNVVIYSRDSDIRALGYFSSQYLDLENEVHVRSTIS